MKHLMSLILILAATCTYAQSRVNPIIKNYGGIYDVPDATVKPDPDQTYKIVIDVYGGAEEKEDLDKSLNNVARMLNLHGVAGVPVEQIKVVLALHGQSTFSALDHEAYREAFGMDNPNAGLVKELKAAGVKIAVCGQSLKSRGYEKQNLLDEVELATSMLTTITYYQTMGYMLLKF